MMNTQKINENSNAVLDFVKNNYKFLAYVIFGLFMFYWIVFILTPKIKMGAESKQILDSLNIHIKTIEENQKALDEKLEEYGNEINEVETRITEIKSQKTTIKEIYHEKINSVNSYNDHQLDSFFTVRYGYYENSR
jgi:vacuolar-type H+-ATPase subunit I/STV1